MTPDPVIIGSGRRRDGPEIELRLRVGGVCAAGLINAAIARGKPATALRPM